MNKLIKSVKQNNFSYFAQNIRDVDNFTEKENNEFYTLLGFSDRKYRENLLRYDPELGSMLDIKNSYHIPQLVDITKEEMQHYKKNCPDTYQWMVDTAFGHQMTKIPRKTEREIIDAIELHGLGDSKKFDVYLNFKNIAQIIKYMPSSNHIAQIMYKDDIITEYEILTGLEKHFGWNAIMQYGGRIVKNDQALHNVLDFALANNKDLRLITDYYHNARQLYEIKKEKKDLEKISANNTTKIQKL